LRPYPYLLTEKYPRANDIGLLKLATTVLTPWSLRLPGSIEIQPVTGAALWHSSCPTRYRTA
jgi:hypothetical protein